MDHQTLGEAGDWLRQLLPLFSTICTSWAARASASSPMQEAEFIRRHIPDSGMMSALFDEQGQRTEGDAHINVRRIDVAIPKFPDAGIWWLEVDPVEDYTFLRWPVIDSCLRELAWRQLTPDGLLPADPPNVNRWRWVGDGHAMPLPGASDRRQTTIYHHRGDLEPPSVPVKFIVVGYKPSALLRHFSEQAGMPPAAGQGDED